MYRLSRASVYRIACFLDSIVMAAYASRKDSRMPYLHTLPSSFRPPPLNPSTLAIATPSATQASRTCPTSMIASFQPLRQLYSLCIVYPSSLTFIRTPKASCPHRAIYPALKKSCSSPTSLSRLCYPSRAVGRVCGIRPSTCSVPIR
jgi:hypothetical protein